MGIKCEVCGKSEFWCENECKTFVESEKCHHAINCPEVGELKVVSGTAPYNARAICPDCKKETLRHWSNNRVVGWLSGWHCINFECQHNFFQLKEAVK